MLGLQRTRTQAFVLAIIVTVINIIYPIIETSNANTLRTKEKKKKRSPYLDLFPKKHMMSNKTNNATDLSFDELQRQIGSFDSIPVPRNLNILFSGDSLTRGSNILIWYTFFHMKNG